MKTNLTGMMAAAALCVGSLLLGCGDGVPAETDPSGSGGSGGADASGGDTGDGGGDVVVNPGRNDYTIDVNGVDREFIVYATESTLASEDVPVVFFFHGSNQTGELAYGVNPSGSTSDQITGWREKADTEKLIVVFPTALNYCIEVEGDDGNPFNDVQEKWANGMLTSGALKLCTADDRAALEPKDQAKIDATSVVSDEPFVEAMFDLLTLHYPVDSKRFYLSGFSGGGGYVSRLVQEQSEVFAAAQNVGASHKEVAAPASRPMSFTILVGTHDNKMQRMNELYGTGVKEPLPFGEMGVDGLQLFVTHGYMRDHFIDPILTVLQLTDQGIDTPEFISVGGQDAMILWTFDTSTAGADNVFRFVLVNQLIHSYPNGHNHPLVGADAAWDEFQDQSLP